VTLESKPPHIDPSDRAPDAAQSSEPPIPEAMVQALMARCKDPEPYERLSALRQLIQYVPDRAVPFIEAMAKEDPVSTIRHFCRTELDRREKIALEAAVPQHHSINERHFQGNLALCYMLFALLFLGAGIIGLFSVGPNGDYSPKVSLIRFLGGMPFAHLTIAGLCVWAAFEVKRSSFEGYVVKWVALLLILFSFPLGPILGTWMLINLSGVGAKARRKRGF